MDVAAAARGGPDTVATAFVTVLGTTDTAIDTSWFEAQLRAAPLAAGEEQRALTLDPPGADDAWMALAAGKGYTTVTVQQQTPPDVSDSDRQAFRLLTVTVHYNSVLLAPRTRSAFLQLRRTAEGWRVHTLTWQA